mmetsp:Transcript_37943/g.92768  ORF Transcript_37943/g.92768 Transcript_37943/m.92768 type:complete len:975 (-) Transcript_37943:53-2977(-)
MAQHSGLAGAVPREASLKQSIRESSVAREPRERFAPGHCPASVVSISFIVFHVLDSLTNFTVFFVVVDNAIKAILVCCTLFSLLMQAVILHKALSVIRQHRSVARAASSVLVACGALVAQAFSQLLAASLQIAWALQYPSKRWLVKSRLLPLCSAVLSVFTVAFGLALLDWTASLRVQRKMRVLGYANLHVLFRFAEVSSSVLFLGMVLRYVFALDSQSTYRPAVVAIVAVVVVLPCGSLLLCRVLGRRQTMLVGIPMIFFNAVQVVDIEPVARVARKITWGSLLFRVLEAAAAGATVAIAHGQGEDPDLHWKVWENVCGVLGGLLILYVVLFAFMVRNHRPADIFSAAARGDAFTLGEILKDLVYEDLGSPPVNAYDCEGLTVLHLACIGGHVDCAHLILRQPECDPNLPSQCRGRRAQWTAVHFACARGDVSVLRELVDANADPAMATDRGVSPLSLARDRGCKVVLQKALATDNTGDPSIEEGAQTSFSSRNPLLARATDWSLGGSSLRGSAYLNSLLSGVSLHDLESSSCSRKPHRTAADRRETIEVERVGRGTLQDIVTLGGNHNGNLGDPVVRTRCSEECQKYFMQTAGGGAFRRAVMREIIGSRISQPSPAPPKVAQPPAGAGDTGALFETVRRVGSGSYGEVYEVRAKMSRSNTKAGNTYAMKVLEKRRYLAQDNVKYAWAERNVLKVVRHPCLVRLHRAFQVESPHPSWVLVMEYCSGGSLQTKLVQCGRLDEALARRYSAEVLAGLQYLHTNRIVFRDIKPANIVISGSDHCKITDFGLAKANVDGFSTNSMCGTHGFMAPEVGNAIYGVEVDIYSWGVTVFMMLTGGERVDPMFGEPTVEPPSSHKMLRQILAYLRLPTQLRHPDEDFEDVVLSPEALSLLHKVTDEEPQQRPTAFQLVADDFYKDLNWEQLAMDCKRDEEDRFSLEASEVESSEVQRWDAGLCMPMRPPSDGLSGQWGSHRQ